MMYRRLGKTGLRVSRLGLGTMSFGGDADAATAGAIFGRCRDVGINLFDCADVYAGGESERILGRLLADCRDEVVLTTKAYFPTGTGPNDRGSSRYHLTRAVEASLKRLGTDRIDLFFLHRFDDHCDLEESLRAVDAMVRQGKILYVGVSNFSAWETMKAVGICERLGLSPITCVQPMYNLVKRQAEVEILPMARAEGIGVMPYSPLGGGLLSGKYGRDKQPESGRIVDTPFYAVRYGAEANFEVAEAFTALAAELELDPVALAIAWVAAHPAVTAPLIGARNLEQLEGALGALDVNMHQQLRICIGALSPTPPPATDRSEERTGTATFGSAVQEAIEK